ncbi:MAG TPA: heavy metal translocating P-type ATPase [Chloroflexota bacterium]|nr:heavy metal translocating P-type ATPase [Chloroflexota bacterium]
MHQHEHQAHEGAPSQAIPSGSHEGHVVEEFERRFWVCLALTIPILVYADLPQEVFHYSAPTFPGSQLLSPLLATVIYFYGGIVFLRGAGAELASRTPGMMTLVALAITVAYGYSLAVQFVLGGMPLYWELATLVDIMLLGHWVEMRAVGRARGALAELAKLMPDEAERVVQGGTELVPVQEIRVGDLVLARPGGRVPADGIVETGESHVNESMITGESRPVPKAPGDRVIAGSVNEEGSLRVRVNRVGEDTALAGIMRLVERAQHSRSAAQALADRAAGWITYAAVAVGLITLVGWLLLAAGVSFALERMVTVLVIACPHALGLAIPLVISISTGLAARNGLLVRERMALEQARDLDVIVFDKTGTLTRGEQGVAGVAAIEGLTVEDALMLTAAVEGDSEHAIARAIRGEAERRGLVLPAAEGFQALVGRGVRAVVRGRVLRVGGPRLLEATGVEPPTELRERAEDWGRQGKSVVFLLEDDRVMAALALADLIRPESKEAVSQLSSLGIEVAMMTGDSEDVAASVARELGIHRYFARLLPEDKAGRVQELRRQGSRVGMVGDGINDAPALLMANVGIAVGAGTNVAIESAGIILVRDDPRDVVKVIRLSHASYRKMVENLAWATGYNVIAIPLAAGVLAPFGIFLAPAVGALLMSASTVIVALNAQLLRWTRLSQ